MTTNNELLTEEALDAFWAVIAENFPKAKTGDLSPLTSLQLDRAAEAAVSEWIGSNVPHANSEVTTTDVSSDTGADLPENHSGEGGRSPLPFDTTGNE